MVAEGLSPGVQDGEKADLGAQMCRVAGDGPQGLGRGAEEDPIDDRFVLVGDDGDRGGQGEHDMEILGRQEIRRAGDDPRCTRQGLALGTVTIPVRNGELSVTCLMGSDL